MKKKQFTGEQIARMVGCLRAAGGAVTCGSGGRFLFCLPLAVR
jgi:hypothetical protein